MEHEIEIDNVKVGIDGDGDLSLSMVYDELLFDPEGARKLADYINEHFQEKHE